MTDRKKDIDVNELLHQLEELKKKKAQNVKKLKRKLGRAIQLSKPESGAVLANYNSNSSEQKNSFLKLQTQATKNFSNKLNCENLNLSKIKLADAEQENFPRGSCDVETYTCSSLQPSNLNKELCKDSKLAPQSASGNGTITEATLKFEFKTLDVPKSANPENCIQGEEFQYCGKRSSDTEKEDIFDCQSSMKRVKLCNVDKKKCNLESDTNHLSGSCHVNIDEIGRQLVPNSIKVINKNNELTLQKNSCNIPDAQKSGTIELNDQSHTSLIIEHVTAVKNLSSNFHSLKTVNCVKDDDMDSTCMQANATLIEETKAVMGSSQQIINVLESSSSVQLHKKTCDINSEVEIDPNVTEVADTEIGFDKKLQINFLGVQEGFLNLNSEIADRKDAVELSLQDTNLKKTWKTDYVYKNEDICLENIQLNVASFDEISTEIPQTEVIESTIHIENRDLIQCDFTDNESDYSKSFDSNELEALCQSDYEKDPENSDNESQQNCLSNEDDTCSTVCSKVLEKDYQVINCNNSKTFINIPDSGNLAVDSDLFVVPETELFDFARYNDSGVEDIGHNISVVSTDYNEGKKKVENVQRDYLAAESYSLNSEIIRHVNKYADLNICNQLNIQIDETKPQIELSSNKVIVDELDTDSLGIEDFLKLVNCQQMSFQSDSPKEMNLSDEKSLCLNFQCSLQSDINEAVTSLKLAFFNNSQYIFIQHITWIQVWRQEKDHDWMKIFAHQVEGFELQSLCLSQSETYLVLVMLLNSEKKEYCLHFLVFENENRLIKLMEHTHWLENRYEEDEDILLCGLDDLKFASAKGSDAFKVYSHSFSCLDGDPIMLTVTLGSLNDCLHSLCRIDKLPNALLGMSSNMLYIWHLLETRLVTSVSLQVDSFDIENCIWTVIENGLIFLIAACKEKENSGTCQLLAANLATGFCEVALTYSLQPALEMKSPLNRKFISYSEPLIGMTCENGAFIWSVEEEYCCAFLKGSNYTSVSVVPTFTDSFLVIVGCNEGCVNCYELKSQQ